MQQFDSSTFHTAPGYGGNTGFRRVSRRNPCKICKRPDWCREFDDGGMHCMREPSSTECSCGGWMHWPNGERPADWLDRLEALPPPAPGPEIDPALADAVYSSLLSLCPLDAIDRADLHRRGFTDDQIARHRYATWPDDPGKQQGIVAAVIAEHGESIIGRVPGFWRQGGNPAFSCHPGRLQPDIRDGHVVRLKVRLRNVTGSGKFRWVSSFEKPDGISCPASIHEAVGSIHLGNAKRLAFVEGIDKANMVADRLGMVAIAVASLGSTRDLVEMMRKHDATEAVLLFDMDRLTNPDVKAHEQRTADYFKRNGYSVLRGSWPEEQKGIDDALNAHLLPVLEPVAASEPIDTEEVKRLRTDLTETRLQFSNIVQVFLNPHMPQSEKLGIISTINIAEQKRQRGEIRSDGTVELTAAEIADDWRAAPTQKGESLAPTNANGTKPRMSRQQVKPLMETLVSRGFIRATQRETIKRRGNSSTYEDRVWDIALPEKTSDILAFAAAWQPDQPKQRKPRSQAKPCPHCGEVHAIVRKDFCTGCGALRDQRTIEPAEQVDVVADASPHVPKNSGHGDGRPSGSPLVNVLDVPKNSGHGRSAIPSTPSRSAPPRFNAPPEPAWLHDSFQSAAPAPFDRFTDVSYGGRS